MLASAGEQISDSCSSCNCPVAARKNELLKTLGQITLLTSASVNNLPPPGIERRMSGGTVDSDSVARGNEGLPKGQAFPPTTVSVSGGKTWWGNPPLTSLVSTSELKAEILSAGERKRRRALVFPASTGKRVLIVKVVVVQP